ncbi:MAG: aminoglycoside adenylyltransferase domain-containing protein [Ktedonobacterales bacterium]
MLNSTPTIYTDLNTVLCELVTTTHAILGENFCGAYLQGSFAVGDADASSDVDFVVVTHTEISDDHVAALGSMHARFPTLDVEWAKHLEGSYIPKGVLRRPGPSCGPFLYVDNGSPHLEWSNHDNTAVVRWALREYGIVLAGPDPASLVDEVTADVLRSEIRRTMRERAQDLRASRDSSDKPWSAWLQPHVVLAYCRMLHTLSTGRVGSKLAAGHWALSALDDRWADLLHRALDDRPDPWERVHRPADPALVAATWTFIDYALQRAETTQP